MEQVSVARMRSGCRWKQVRTSKDKGPTDVLSASPSRIRKRKTLQKLSWEIMMMCIVCKMFRKGLKGFREILVKEAEGIEDNLAVLAMEDEKNNQFDCTMFKIKQDCFPRKAELITLKKPKWRTENELNFLCNILKSLQSFKIHSSHLQILLAKVLRFERFGRRRVIIKKDQVGNSFYFIYSGCVAVCDDDGSSIFTEQEPFLLHKGAGFGDISLLKGLRRNATIVCMNTTELLVVDKEDFYAYKLDEELEKELRYRFDFFSSLDIFSHLSTENIENIAERCQTMTFRHGQVVILDTTETNSIAFITEGTCELLRLVNLAKCPSYNRWLHLKISSMLPNVPSFQQPFYEKSHQYIHAQRKKKEWREWMVLDKATSKHNDPERNRKVDNALEGTSYGFQGFLKMPTTIDSIPTTMAVAVYFRMDLLHKGQFLGLHEYLLPESQRDKRNYVLASKGCKIVFLKRKKFLEFCDETTIKNLQKYQRSYPSDDILCQLFLQENNWKNFKKDLVKLLMEPLSSGLTENKNKNNLFQSLSTTYYEAGILDLCSIFQYQHFRNTTEKHKYIVIPTQGKRDHPNPPDTSLRLINAIAVPGPNLKRVIF